MISSSIIIKCLNVIPLPASPHSNTTQFCLQTGRTSFGTARKVSSSKLPTSPTPASFTARPSWRASNALVCTSCTDQVSTPPQLKHVHHINTIFLLQTLCLLLSGCSEQHHGRLPEHQRACAAPEGGEAGPELHGHGGAEHQSQDHLGLPWKGQTCSQRGRSRWLCSDRRLSEEPGTPRLSLVRE